MKKFLLSLAVFAGFTAMAKEVTFDFINNDYGLERLSGSTQDYIDEGASITSDGVTLTFSSAYGEESKNESGCRLWSTSGFRMYNGGTITVTADEHISNVVINPVVSAISITEGEDSWTLAYTPTSKNGQFTTLTVTLGEAAELPELPEVNSVKETIALAAKTKFIVNYELTVGFAKDKNVFACDAAGDFIQLYGQVTTLKSGDVIPAGWEATYDLYVTTPEIINYTLPEVTEGTFVAKEVAAADVTADLVNYVIKIKDVVFAEATPGTVANFTGNVGDVELTFRNNYSCESVEAGTYDVTVVVNIYKGAVQLYVISYEASDTSGIEAIEAETAAPVYYNLQGVEVANPENGIFIVRRGNKVSKEIIR